MLQSSKCAAVEPNEARPNSQRIRGSARERLLILLLLTLQTAALTWIDWQTAPGWDEWGHLPSGLFHLQYGQYKPYCVNPPLVRTVAALPVLAAGGSIRWVEQPNSPGWRSEWVLRSIFLHAYGERCFEFFSLARMALIPVSLLGTYLLWSIGRRFYGRASGWVAAILWCFSPTALAFGGTIAPDVSAAVFGFLAAYRFYIWLRMGTWSSAIWLGVATAIALLSKSTWLILPPVFAMLWLCDRIMHRRPPWAADARQWLVGFAIAWLVIHVAYDFRGTLRPLGSFSFRSQLFTGNDSPSGATGNRFADAWTGRIPMPLPADYIQGIDIQRTEFEAGHQSYLFGTWRDRGWWYYYVTGVFLKEPVALWGLIALFVVGAILRKQRRVSWREVVVYAPGLAVLAFVSSQTGFNHHVRYVLPFFPCLYLIAARSVAVIDKWIKVAAFLFCGWYAFSSASILPRSYAFFTEAVGGANQGWRYLSDSNLDWGQDLLTLRDWANANPDKRPIWLLYSPEMLNFRLLGIDATNGQPRVVGGRPAAAGWWAVFATPMTAPENKWFLDRPATIRLSPTLKLIDVSPADLEAIRNADN